MRKYIGVMDVLPSSKEQFVMVGVEVEARSMKDATAKCERLIKLAYDGCEFVNMGVSRMKPGLNNKFELVDPRVETMCAFTNEWVYDKAKGSLADVRRKAMEQQVQSKGQLVAVSNTKKKAKKKDPIKGSNFYGISFGFVDEVIKTVGGRSVLNYGYGNRPKEVK